MAPATLTMPAAHASGPPIALPPAISLAHHAVLALDLGTLPATVDESERMYAANPRLRMWQIGVVRGLVAAGRLDDARVHYEDLVGADGVALRDFDYVDIGRMRLPSGMIPLTVKSLRSPVPSMPGLQAAR